MAGTFNDYFTSIASTVRTTEDTNCENLQRLESFLSTDLSHEDKYMIREIEECFVENYLKMLPTKKAVGLDEISSRQLKASASVIVPSITRILNLSIRLGIFHLQWKIS